ncbi:MAG TPA: helix-turn-helix domain-containing protein, partial [Kofleriaceae bacterium]|nr:helix-turn-helix domain-containing protein [Kofleriaceae bacterium]
TATQRVAAWLRDEGPTEMTLFLPRRIAADLLGMRPETLSRALGTLARRGAIRVSRQELWILDRTKLVECAG